MFTSHLQADFIDRKAEGWHFYEELLTPKVPEPESEQSSAPETPQTPTQQLAALKKELEDVKAAAVMNPTFQNVKAYMQMQKHVMDKSSAFAQRWLEVLYQTPHLDYSIKHPTAQAARHVYLDEQKKQILNEVHKLSQTHGLFFFFSQSCSYCKHFAPIVKQFSERFGWEVMAISMDGSTLPEFPDAVPDNGTAKALGVEFVPTLLAVNPLNEEVIPLSHGMSSQDQILDRIRVLIIERNKS